MTLTNDDIKKLSNLIDNRLDLKKLSDLIDNRLDLKLSQQEEKFEAHTTKLKSDFHNEIGPILKEVVTARDERPLMNSNISKHTDQISALEKLHPHGKHQLAV